MKNIINVLYKGKIGRYFLIPLFLSAFWISLTLLYIINFDTSFSIWSYNHQQSNFSKLTFNNLYKGDQITGHFVAQDKNLGIVAIRFQTYIKPPYAYEDQFLFRIKERGAKNWYYQNIYKSGLMYSVPFFPFGFPQISDSNGRQYEFELISLNGNNTNAISISDRNPILVSKYKYSRSELIKNKFTFLKFFAKKVYNAMLTPDVWFSSLIYFLPLLFYLFWISLLEKYLEPLIHKLNIKFEKLAKTTILGPILVLLRKIFVLHFDAVIIFVVLVDVLIIQLTNDVVYLVLIALWIATLKAYKSDGKSSFVFASFLLLMSALFSFFKAEPTAEKSTIWAYTFFIAGTIQALLELRPGSEVHEKT